MATPTSRSKPRLPGPGAEGHDRRGDGDASIATLGREFKDLVIGYAKQETLDPLKVVARFVAWGVVGAVLISTGVGLITLAVVRSLQGELGSHLQGSLTWVPYTAGLLFAVVVAALAASRIGKGSR